MTGHLNKKYSTKKFGFKYRVVGKHFNHFENNLLVN